MGVVWDYLGGLGRQCRPCLWNCMAVCLKTWFASHPSTGSTAAPHVKRAGSQRVRLKPAHVLQRKNPNSCLGLAVGSERERQDPEPYSSCAKISILTLPWPLHKPRHCSTSYAGVVRTPLHYCIGQLKVPASLMSQP